MKKFATIFSIFLVLSFSMNIVTTVAQPKSFSQGIYSVTDSKFLVGTSYNIQNTAPNDKVLLMVIDGNQQIQELIPLEPNSPKYYLKPLDYDFLVVIIGKGQVAFS